MDLVTENAQLQAQVDVLQTQVDALVQKIAALEAELTERRTSNAALTKEISRRDAQDKLS